MQLENGSLHYNHDLKANLVQVLNTKVVPCDILSMFKVLLGSHKHFTHWSHVNPSLGINLRGITCDISKVVKIEFDMLMLMNAQWCLCSCNANAKCMLNTRVLQPLPPYRNLVLRLERPTNPCRKWGRRHAENRPFPTLHLAHYGCSTPLYRT